MALRSFHLVRSSVGKQPFFAVSARLKVPAFTPAERNVLGVLVAINISLLWSENQLCPVALTLLIVEKKAA